MHAIELDLLRAAAVRLVDRALHRARDPVGVEDGFAANVARGTPDRLDQRALGAQEAFLVGVENGDERHLGQVESFAQQIDADEHVELAEPKIADDLHALDGFDVGVQIAHAHAVLLEIIREVLGHALRQRGDQHALAERRRVR